MNNIQVLVFDGDGVTIKPPRRFSEILAEDFSIDTTTTKDFFTGVFQDCLRGKADLKEELPKYLQSWGFAGSVEDLLRVWFDGENHPDKTLLSQIGELREAGYLTALLSDNEKYRSEYIMHKMYFSEKFDYVFTSGNTGFKKSDPETYNLVQEKTGITDPSAYLFFDDDPDNVAKAQEHGWLGVVYTSYENAARALNQLISSED